MNKSTDDIINSRSEVLKKAIRKAFEDNRDYLLFKFNQLLSSTKSNNQEIEYSAESDWLAIDSMSKLRAIVGGRFDTLKSKWVAAALPVKQKKGDEIPEFSVDLSGWSELENWLMKMGYKARLRSDLSDRVFEIKKML